MKPVQSFLVITTLSNAVTYKNIFTWSPSFNTIRTYISR